MSKYLISITPGVSPGIYVMKSVGFIKATTRQRAIAQAAKYLNVSCDRLIARAKNELGASWEIEQELVSELPNICKFGGCSNILSKVNKSGYCLKHRESSPKRRKRN